MARRRDGHIVNVSSLAGRFAFAGGAVYSGTKFAVRAISDGLRREALAYGVRVTDIEPGAVATELVQTIRHEGTRQAVTGEGSFYAPGAKILEHVAVANAILYAVTQPTHVNVSEMLIRPTIQAF
jgi:NADP-dependent 3-hydroxy acid dehydrogenase YdfG